MTVEHWYEKFDIDQSAQALRDFLEPYNQEEILATQILSSYVTELDKKAGINPQKFDGYQIVVPETSFSDSLLPKVIAERVGMRKCSMTLKREPGLLDLEFKELQTGKIVGFNVDVKLMAQDVRDAGTRLLTADGELEEDPESTRKYKLVDVPLNDFKYQRLVTAAVLFSKVIDQLLSNDYPVQALKE